MNINFPILELASITQQFYDDGTMAYHMNISYLIDVNGIETVLEVFPTNIDQVKQYPLVTDETQVTVMRHQGTSNICIGSYQVGDDESDPRKTHKELIIEHLLEGNNREDLAEYAYDLMSEDERNKILDEIDNAQLEEDVKSE